ncbi:MAG: hypothetical protein LBE13_22210 [Bacteroidales bacterium]|jgi:hypothetical protein|nr:hypothetical protein [Bacteroidales bacterium]
MENRYGGDRNDDNWDDTAHSRYNLEKLSPETVLLPRQSPDELPFSLCLVGKIRTGKNSRSKKTNDNKGK